MLQTPSLKMSSDRQPEYRNIGMMTGIHQQVHKREGVWNNMKNLKMKSARVAKDLSQQQLADLIGVSRQTISAIEKGDYNPTINLCIAICRQLDKTLDELFWE